MPTIALVTCKTLPKLDPDDQLLLETLRALGVDPVAAVWDDASVDWDEFDLAVIRNTWDYPARRTEFINWARRVPRLANPADIVEWNTDKRYLAELASAGVPVVPTTWIAPGEAAVLPSTGRYVLKPSVGAGSVDAKAFTMDTELSYAREHAFRLLAAGSTVMIQPYVDAIDERGETALMFMGGEFSHAVLKGAMLGDAHGLVDGLYYEEKIGPTEPTPGERDIARIALAAVPGGSDRLTYARVDLVPSASGEPVVLELELTEPSLFMVHAPAAPERFARVLAGQIERPGARPSAAIPASSAGERLSSPDRYTEERVLGE